MAHNLNKGENAMYKLRVIQAEYGDGLILEFGNETPMFILIDGGPTKAYTHLKKELSRIKNNGGNLHRMILTHVDGDHIRAQLKLMKELEDGTPNDPIEVEGLWHNSFSQSDSDSSVDSAPDDLISLVGDISSDLVVSIREGVDLAERADRIGIPINSDFNGDLIKVVKGTKVKIENLTLHILGPTQENLDKMKSEWDKKTSGRPSILETPANLSSIMFLAEAEKKTILFTGDGQSEDIEKGLEIQELLKNEHPMVDIMKVPHHGSKANVTPEFFEKISAYQYVISGSDDHPNYETLTWILNAAKKDNRRIEIIVTNENDAIVEFKKKYDEEEHNYEIRILKPGHNAVVIDCVSGNVEYES